MESRPALFVDTWGWVALESQREPRQVEVEALNQNFRQGGGIAYTTDSLLDETITMIFKRTPVVIAQEFLKEMEEAMAQGHIQLERITPERFERAKQLRLQYKDKPRISFTDFTSMVVMSELGITEVLTEDDHFIQVGMGFHKVP
jgi:predicted nucleic acid-binding protein